VSQPRGVPVVRGHDRPVVVRGPRLPTLQRLVDRDAGSAALTVLRNEFSGGEQIPDHVHDVEEVLVAVAGSFIVQVGDQALDVAAGDAVIIAPGVHHAVRHVGAGPGSVVAVLASPDVVIPEVPVD
jgi:quercetin dioxygenase-like cupin family protein